MITQLLSEHENYQHMVRVLAGALFYANEIAARLAGVRQSEWWAVAGGWQDLDKVAASDFIVL